MNSMNKALVDIRELIEEYRVRRNEARQNGNWANVERLSGVITGLKLAIKAIEEELLSERVKVSEIELGEGSVVIVKDGQTVEVSHEDLKSIVDRLDGFPETTSIGFQDKVFLTLGEVRGIYKEVVK